MYPVVLDTEHDLYNTSTGSLTEFSNFESLGVENFSKNWKFHFLVTEIRKSFKVKFSNTAPPISDLVVQSLKLPANVQIRIGYWFYFWLEPI